MLDRFISHIREKKILDTKKHYLLALSGGLDSMVLFQLLHLSGFSFSIAHCNFGLRGQESDGDEAFVRKMADRISAQAYVKKFETKSYSKAKGISKQMAARELRYQWFEEILEGGGLDGVLVAHHADDQIETVLLNLLRGTGIEGLYGMAETREHIIRPLLPFSRKELYSFAKEENLPWREDSSNIQSEYKRNFLRHKVIPEIEKFDPAALSLFQISMERIKDTGKAFFHLFDAWLETHIHSEGNFQYLKLDLLAIAPGKKSLLYYWIRAFGFNYSQATDIVLALDSQESGKSFHTKEYTINLDRDYLILGPQEHDTGMIYLDKTDVQLGIGKDQYDLFYLSPEAEMDRSSSNAMLDLGNLNFPLQVRNWEVGDRFRPLGMKRFKKVSDFLIDLKVPMIVKRSVKVLCSGEDIVWVIGLRIDDRYKLSQFTQSILYIKKK
jgi:tRNA(Ile)-lysidine synthase